MKKVFVKEEQDVVLCALYERDELARFFRLKKGMLTGSIVVGKVVCVKKSVGVFVDIGLERDGLLSFRPGLKPGDAVLVRVETEPQPERGCSLTEKINLAGKYAVLTDGGEYKFSREISEERKIELFRLPRREDVGFIFRSLAAAADIEKIEAETEALFNAYAALLKVAKTTRAPAVLYRVDPVETAKNFGEEVSFDFSAVEKDIEELGKRKIERDGVELVFDKTEALTAVDVNFHRYAERGDGAVFSANKIAVQEFARQVRLRNIGGLIVLDYICLPRAEDREELFSFLKEELKKDYVTCSVEHAEKAGLFIVVRQERYS
ncbi:MAG: ribonuclease E/G [Clostridia bacterium]|nr:ribonuclease E/G [Clostridia bacterium]